MHAADRIEYPADNLKLLLKVFSMFKITIMYDETIDNEDDPEAVEIMCIHCGKFIGCLLENQKIEDFITTFVRNMVFSNNGLFLDH